MARDNEYKYNLKCFHSSFLSSQPRHLYLVQKCKYNLIYSGLSCAASWLVPVPLWGPLVEVCSNCMWMVHYTRCTADKGSLQLPNRLTGVRCKADLPTENAPLQLMLWLVIHQTAGQRGSQHRDGKELIPSPGHMQTLPPPSNSLVVPTELPFTMLDLWL